MENSRKVGAALSRLYGDLEAVREGSGWETRLKCAGYMKHRSGYAGTSVPNIVTHEDMSRSYFDTFTDGFIGYLMPHDDTWFSMVPSVSFDERKEYGGFGSMMRDRKADDMLRVGDDVVQMVLDRFAEGNMYECARIVCKDGETFGKGFMYIEDRGDGKVSYMDIDPQEVVCSENRYGEMEVFIRKFLKSPAELVSEFPDASMPLIRQRFRSGTDVYNPDVEVMEAIIRKKSFVDPETGLPFPVDEKDAREFCHIVYVVPEMEVVLEGSFSEMPVVAYTPERDNSMSPWGKGLVGRCIEEIVTLDVMRNLKMIGYEKNANPPMMVHESLHGAFSTKAGARNYTNDISAQTAVPLFKEGASNNYQAMVNDIQDARDQIRQLMNADLFRTLMSSTDSRKTAYEVSELKNEAVTLLSMKVGGFERSVIQPMVRRTIRIMLGNMESEVYPGVPNRKLADYVCTFRVMLNSVFVRRLQGYIKYQGLVSGIQFIGAWGQVEQTKASMVVDSDVLLRSGLFGAGFPAYCIKTMEDLEKDRDAQKRMSDQMMQAQLNEQNSKAMKNMASSMPVMEGMQQ